LLPDASGDGAAIDSGISHHLAPAETAGVFVGRYELVITREAQAGGIRAAHHHHFAALPHHLLADVRLAATSPAKRLVAQDHGVFVIHAGFRNKEPLALPDRLASLYLCRTQAGNCGSHIANTITRHSCSKPVAFIAPKQELMLFSSVSNHQHQVMRPRLHVDNFDCNPFFTPDDEHFAGTVPAYIDCNLRPLPEARSAHNDARTHTGEVPTQILLGRHTFPSNCWGLPLCAAEEGRERAVLRRASYTVTQSMIDPHGRLLSLNKVARFRFRSNKLPNQG
jgi:hypothetical protein